MALSQEKVEQLIEVVDEASLAVMQFYDSGIYTTEYKADDSPLTQADVVSHNILVRGISRVLKGVPIVSEEGDVDNNRRLVKGNNFMLIDPIDGTREFIARSGDFTVCVGHIEDNVPTFGIIAAPAKGTLYYGGPDMGSFKRTRDGLGEPIHVRPHDPVVVMASRLHLNTATRAYIDEHYPEHEIVSAGSQLKFPMIAEGIGDVCPRIESPLHIWDVAAGHAILTGAGGTVTKIDGSPLNYQEPSLRIGDFIARN